MVWFIAILLSLMSWSLTGLFRIYALRYNLLDKPNHRSSHTQPTPKGAGVIIAFTFATGIYVLSIYYAIAQNILLGLLGSGMLLSVIGYIDDKSNLSAIWRLLAHFVAAIWLLFFFSQEYPLQIFGLNPSYQWFAYVLLTIYIVWLLNLYNFMDGINGIAGIETITICVGGTLLLYVAVPSSELWIIPLCLASVVLGFLFWNFPNAKIFMGDSGSAFLGVTVAAFSLLGEGASVSLFWSWLILLGVFLTDATVTLLRRVMQGEKFYQAHRSHAYQWASRKWGHTKVSLSVGLINIVWLFPLSYLSYRYSDFILIILLIAFVPLVYTAILLGAGQKEPEI